MIYGADRMLQDLENLGYKKLELIEANNQQYISIQSFIVTLGQFSSRVIDLAIPVPPDYPRTVGASIHIKSTPQLLEKEQSIPNVRNIIDSPLGAEWRYWSFRFLPTEGDSTQNLIHQINGIFRTI